MNILHWYVAHTQPRHEKKVLEHLRLRNVETFLPLYLASKRWKNGMKMNLELPLFPGYVFVRTSLDHRLDVLTVPSVVNIIGSGPTPIPVPDKEIELLANKISQLGPEPHPFVKIGDRVRLKSGPLAGLEGILVQKKDRFRFILSMDLIMQSISVEVDTADVEYQPGLPLQTKSPVKAVFQIHRS